MIAGHQIGRGRVRALAERRWLFVASLALLFLVGPVHVWHHVGTHDDSVPGEDAHCLPCAAFHKTHFVAAAASSLVDVGVCWEIVESGSDTSVVGVELSIAPSRAPPSLG